MPHPLVITTCSARKRLAPNVRSAELPRGSQSTVCDAWLAALARSHAERPAREVYIGRAIATAFNAARILDADVVIVSAGLGCVRATTAIPGYDLTLTRDGVRAHVEGAFDAAAWWRCVERGPYSARLADELHGRPLVLACLSRAYAPLVAPELAAIPPDRLRIFGRALDGVLPPAVAACVLPYDDRLETAGPPGTRSDFAQRALMHYAEKIAPSSDGSLALDRAAVTAALASQPQPRSIPARTRADDEAIRELIARLLPVVGKGSSAMLRHLRDREGFACEQGRFARLYRDVAERS